MPLTGDFKKLKKLETALRELGSREGRLQRDAASEIVKGVKELVRAEFTAGDGLYGDWPETVRGKPALRSKKLPQAYAYRYDQQEVLFMLRVPWLTAHQEGHKFPARQAAGGALRFNAKGLLTTAKKFAKAKRGRAVFFGAHHVGQRILPARPIFPTSSRGLPVAWRSVIRAGAVFGMRKWHQRASK